MGHTHAIDSLKGVLITLGTSIGAVMLVVTFIFLYIRVYE